MYTVKFIFKEGTPWNLTAPSLMDPSKPQSGLEHIIVTKGLSLDEGIDLLSYVKSLPIEISEDDDPNKVYNASVVFYFGIEDETMKNEVVRHLQDKLPFVAGGYTAIVEEIKNETN